MATTDAADASAQVIHAQHTVDHHAPHATNIYTYTCYSLYDMYLWDLKCYISNYKCHFNRRHKLQYIRPPTHSSPESEYKTREYKRNLKNWNSARSSKNRKIASVTIKSNFKLSMRHKLQDILVKTITDYLYMHIEIYIYMCML